MPYTILEELPLQMVGLSVYFQRQGIPNLAKHFHCAKLVHVIGGDDAALKAGRIEPESLNGGDVMELRVFGSDALGQAVLVAKLDNLGKGASGAAVQCMGLMLGM